VGARRKDIKLQFLVESIAISSIGGVLGIAVGVGIAHGVALYADWRTVVTLPSVVLATFVSVAVGVVSGFSRDPRFQDRPRCRSRPRAG
jgi:ABC-type antimicrobial peptide transport system permease subunit